MTIIAILGSGICYFRNFDFYAISANTSHHQHLHHEYWAHYLIYVTFEISISTPQHPPHRNVTFEISISTPQR